MSGEMPGGGIPVHVQGMAGMPAGMTSLQVHFFSMPDYLILNKISYFSLLLTLIV